ncbi:MAG: hypothetical protein ACE5DK_05295 [Paracoccaceae bacterium]
MHAQIHTAIDLMTAAARALREGDQAALMDLIEISAGWLQPDTEADAQRAMLEAMIEAIDNIPDWG